MYVHALRKLRLNVLNCNYWFTMTEQNEISICITKYLNKDIIWLIKKPISLLVQYSKSMGVAFFCEVVLGTDYIMFQANLDAVRVNRRFLWMFTSLEIYVRRFLQYYIGSTNLCVKFLKNGWKALKSFFPNFLIGFTKQSTGLERPNLWVLVQVHFWRSTQIWSENTWSFASCRLFKMLNCNIVKWNLD